MMMLRMRLRRKENHHEGEDVVIFMVIGAH